MLHAHIATWRLDEVGYEHAPTYTLRDQFSEVEVSSWEDGLQSIEDHDWSLPGQDEGDRSLINDTLPIAKLESTISKSLVSVPSTVGIPATSEVRKAVLRNFSQSDQQHYSSTNTLDNDNTGEREVPVATKAVPDVPDTDASAVVAPAEDHDLYGHHLSNDSVNHEEGSEIPSRSLVQFSTTLIDPVSDNLLQAPETASCAEEEHFDTPSQATVDDEFTIPEHVMMPVTNSLRDVLSEDTYMSGPSQVLPMTPSQQATDEPYKCSKAASHKLMPEDLKDFWTQDMSTGTSVLDCPPTSAFTLYKLPLPDTVTLMNEDEGTMDEEPAHFQVNTTDRLSSLATNSPESNHSNITSGDHDVNLFTDADFHGAADPAGAINMPISNLPANVSGGSDVSGQAPEHDGLSNGLTVSIIDGHVATTTSSKADIPAQATTERSNTRVDHVFMTDASDSDGCFQQPSPNQPSPVFAEESHNSEPSESSITPDVQTERLYNDVQEEEKSNISASPQTNDSMLNDRPSVASDLSIQPIGSSAKHCQVECETGSASFIMDQSTATHVANVVAADITADIAFNNPEVQCPSRDSQLQKAVGEDVEKKSQVLAISDQSVSPSYTVVETTATSSPQLVSLSLTVSVVGKAASSPTDPAASSQDNGLSFSMAALTIRSPSTSAPPTGLKRSFDGSNLKADGKEAPVTKKQKLTSEDLTVSETIGIDDAAAEPSVPEATTHSSAKAGVFGDTTKHDDPATVKNVQNDVQDEDVGAVVSDVTAGGFVDVPSEPPVEDVTIITTCTSSERDTADASVNAAPWDSKPYRLRNLKVGRVWESDQTLSPETRRSLESARLRAERKQEAEEESLHPETTPLKLIGSYIEDTELGTRECITAASLSPRIETPISPLNSVSELRGPKITFKPLRPLAIAHVTADSEALHMVISEGDARLSDLADEMGDNKSDELSEIDEEQLSILSLATNEPIHQTIVEAEDTVVPQDCPATIKESAPVSEAPAVGTTEPSLPESRSAHPLLRELDLGYGRRTTRSDTETSTNVPASLPSHYNELEPAPAPVIKKESAPTQAPGITTKAYAPRRTNKYGFIIDPKRRQTRNSTAKPEATRKPKAAPKPKTVPKATLQTPTTATPKTPAKAVPKPATNPEATPTPTTRAAAKSTLKKGTPTRPEVLSITPKSTKFTTRGESAFKAVPAPRVMSEPSTTANTSTPAASLGKRKTRYSAALEGGRRTVTEKGEPVCKRLRSQGGES